MPKLQVSIIAALMLGLNCAAFASPAIFRSISFDEAKSIASKEKKFLLIDFTAAWCGPCKKMDQETWNQQPVEKWVSENAVAVQFDVDKDHKLATDFKVSAMPCIIVIGPADQTHELDRHIGFEDSTKLLEWLDQVKDGKTELVLVKEKYDQAVGKGGEAEVDARYKLAQKLTETGDYAGALTQLIWLWKNIPKESPPMIGVRGSYMVQTMGIVLKKYPASRADFENLREQSVNDRADWITLNALLGEDDQTLQWFDKVKTDPKAVDPYCAHLLQRLLVSKDRWSDLVYLYPHPIDYLDESFQRTEEVKKASAAMSNFMTPEMLVETFFVKPAACVYAGYLAAGKDDEAIKIGKHAIELVDTEAMHKALVSTAARAHINRPDLDKMWSVESKK
ncbi:MAG TPA: thioredoxin domain-containing protein [Planktothrix sp.]